MAIEIFKAKPTATPQPSTDHHLHRIRIYLHLFFVLAILIIFAFWMDHWIRGELGMAEKIIKVMQTQWGRSVLVAGGIVYILLLSLPFVPGVELGILLMCAFGKEGIVFVYLATVIGLCLAFFIGRLVPKAWIRAGLEKIGSSRFDLNQIDKMENIADQQRPVHNFFPRKLCPYLVKYRYLAIAFLINLPGNYILGGGGGIALACGTSRKISWKWFLLTVVLAVLPVPLLAYSGIIQFEAFLED